MFCNKLLLGLLVAMMIAGNAQAALIIYEPFNQTAGTLNAKAGGTGLSGNWSIAQTVTVVTTPTLSYGDLSNSGGQINVINGNGTWASVGTTSALFDAGLLNDGATLWFSYVYQKTTNGGSNEHSGFALGTDRVSPGASGLLLANSGFGLGAYTQSSSLTASSWSGGARANGTTSALQALNTPTLVIGKIVWGADAGSNEMLTLYTRALDDIATEPTTGGGTRTVAGFDQTLLDTISFGQRNSGGTQFYDEIRFGSSYADVAPIPEPSTWVLLGLGIAGLIGVTRRKG